MRADVAGGAVALLGLALLGCDRPASESRSEPVAAPARSTADQPAAGPPPFVESDALAFSHFSGTTGDFLFPEILGSGVALLDYDGDGDLDVYLIQGSPPGPAASPG